MNRDKDEFYKKLYGWYEKFSSMKLWALCCICIFLEIILDLLPCQYVFGFLERIFSYNIGNVIAITVVIWTFTVTLSIYYLGKMDERCFGIRMIEVIIIKYHPFKLFILAIIIMSELLVLIIAAILEWEITIAGIAVLQFFTMVYMFLMVCMETSRTTIIKGIETQSLDKSGDKTDNGKFLIYEMISNIDYENNCDVNVLLDILFKISPLITVEHSEKIGKQLANCIILNGKKSENMWDMLRNWFVSDMSFMEMKRGILMAVVDNLSPSNFNYCNRMLASVKGNDCAKELYLLFVIYNLFLSKYEGENWRNSYTGRIMVSFFTEWNEEDRKKAIILWKHLCIDANEKINFQLLFRHIFREEGHVRL